MNYPTRFLADFAARFPAELLRCEALALLLGAMLLSACPGTTRVSISTATNADTARALALMECQECNAGERGAVLALGDTVVPWLHERLHSGPPLERVAQVDSALSSRNAGRAALPPSVVALQLKDFDAMYRVRSAFALGGIATPTALTALCRERAGNVGGRLPKRPEVVAAIDSAIALMHGTCP